jgi:hypothetical protein
MPAPPLSAQESRLASFCRLFSIVYFLGAVGFAAFPGLTFRLVTLGEASFFTQEAAFWNVLAVAMMVAIATACAVVAQRPRERRHALLPVVAAKLTSSALAALHLAGSPGGNALLAIILTDFPLFVLTLAVYRAAAPGVHSEPARAEPEASQSEQPIQIGVPK